VRRKLHVQIFGALCAVGAVCAGLAFLLGHLLGLHAPAAPRFVRDLGAFIVADLPSVREDPAQRELLRRARRLGASISVWNADGALLAKAGRALAPPSPPLTADSALRVRGQTAWLLLEDGRILGVSYDAARVQLSAGRFLLPLGLLLLVLVLGSYVAARRITGRLARLEQGVNAFGEGALSTQVGVEGDDEVAHLAQAFNRAFARIAGLLAQQRRMLQTASHELRSPLARVRLALEMLADPEIGADARARLHHDTERDIEELDMLIGDLLLAERLHDADPPKEFSVLDLAQLAKEECARVGATCAAPPTAYVGQARMLRSLVRNLLENARRYGALPIVLSLEPSARGVLLRVDDAGEGVPRAEQERIFEPFYRRDGHAEGRGGGVGLGLSLVRAIAVHHGGDVCYVQQPTGSRFEVRLPAHDPSRLTAS
jgi:signal transduction histidine kinase